MQDTVVVWGHWCSQPFAPSCSQDLSPKLYSALLLLAEYSVPLIVSGLSHVYCFSPRTLSYVIKTEAGKSACNISTCSFAPLPSPWGHAPASPLEDETQGTEEPSYPGRSSPANRYRWQPSEMEKAQPRSSELPTNLQLITDAWGSPARTRKIAQLTHGLTYCFKPLNIGIVCYIALLRQ